MSFFGQPTREGVTLLEGFETGPLKTVRARLAIDVRVRRQIHTSTPGLLPLMPSFGLALSERT